MPDQPNSVDVEEADVSAKEGQAEEKAGELFSG